MKARAIRSSGDLARKRRLVLLARSVPLLIVLVAFALRVANLAGQSFWWDEAYSTLLAEKGLRAIAHELRVSDFHPPLHYVMTWAWLPIAGRSEFALRFLAVACGTLTVAIGSRLGRRLYGESGGLVAGTLFALSPFLYYYSQEARMYAPAALFATLALYLLHRALDDGRWRFWLAYAVACLLGLYTFYYFVFVPVFGAVWTLGAMLHSRRQLGRWLAASVVTGVGYAPWLPVLLGRNAVWDSTWATTSSPLKTIAWSWETLTIGLPTLPLYDQPPVAGLLGLLAVLLLFGFVSRRRALSPYFFAVGAFALPLALIAAIAMLKPVYHPRYAVALAPGLLLALTGAVVAPAPAKRGAILTIATSGVARALGVAAILAMVGYGLSNLIDNPKYARDDYRGAVVYVESHLDPADTLIYNVDPGVRYYFHGAVPASFFPGPPYDEEHIAESLNALTQGRHRLWYLRHFEAPTDPEGFVERQLDGHSRKVDERWFGGMRLTLYELPTTPSFATVEIRPVSANFGAKVSLTGYGLTTDAVAAGDKLDVTLRWQVVAPDADYGVWAGLVDEQGRIWGRVDHQPRNSAYQLSGRWRPGETVSTRLALPALVGTPPGDYRIEVGVYRLDNLRGLDLLDAASRRQGQTFRVAPVRVTSGALGRSGDETLPIQPKARLSDQIELSGAKVESPKASPGGQISLTLLWRALGTPNRDESATIRLVGADGGTIAEATAPLGGGRFASESWRVGEIVRDQRRLVVPTNAPAGKATLRVALNGAGAKWVDLAAVEVDAVKRRFDEPEIPQRLDLGFGGQIRLLGYRLEPATSKPGGTVKLTLYWKSLADGMPSYRVFTHLLDADSKIWGQKDAEPVNWARPTSTWIANEIVEDTYEIEVQRDATAGRYDLEVGVYDPATGERLGVSNAAGAEIGDRAILQRVEVR